MARGLKLLSLNRLETACVDPPRFAGPFASACCPENRFSTCTKRQICTEPETVSYAALTTYTEKDPSYKNCDDIAIPQQNGQRENV